MSRIYKVLFLAFLLAAITQSLHLHQSSDNYIGYLKSQQNTINDKVERLLSQISQNSNSVGKQNDIYKKIELLENYIKQQRLLLSEISLSTVDQQLSFSQWVCPQLPDPKKNQINNNLNAIKEDLKDIDKILIPLNVDKLKQDPQNARNQIKDADKNVDDLKNALTSKGDERQLSSINPDKKSNLNAPNWILDGKKVDDLNDQYKKAAESGALQICPSDQPFFSSKKGKCINCDNKQYFSLRTQQCLECYNFDSAQHKCKDSQGSKTNLDVASDNVIVPQGKTIDDYKDTKGIPCPANAPYYTGEQCIKCDKYFDIEAKQCKKCQGKNYYDSKTHVCKMEQKTVTNLDAGKDRLIIPEDKSLNDIAKENKLLQDDYKVTQCPQDKPYYNDYQCISCAEGTFFSLIQKSCGTCPSGNFYSKQSYHCQKPSFYTNLDDPNWSSLRSYPQVKNDIDQKAKDPLYFKCPVQKPFSTGKQCIQCSNQHFDYDKQQCVPCPSNQYFNKNLHNCSYTQNNYQTNPEKAPNLIYEGHPKNEWMYLYYQNIEKNDGMTDCPKDKPFFDGISCILCPSQKPLFNLQFRLCQICNQGTKYNSIHHQCLTTAGNIVTQVPTLQKMAAGIFAS